MKTRFLYIVQLLFFVAASNELCSQKMNITNRQYIDSIYNDLEKNICPELISFQPKYTKRKLELDNRILHLLNEIWKSGQSVEHWQQTLKPISPDVKLVGELKESRYVLKGGYLYVVFTSKSFQGTVISKHLKIETALEVQCQATGFKISDIRLMRDYLIDNCNFPIRLFDLDHFEAESIIDSNLVKLSQSYSNYTFTTNEKDKKFRDLFYNQYRRILNQTYSVERPNPIFLILVANKKIGMLKELLFSPNYLYSIEAMEALKYLHSLNLVALSDEMTSRFNFLKSQTHDFVYDVNDDVVNHAPGYAILKVTDAGIITKYSTAMKDSRSYMQD